MAFQYHIQKKKEDIPEWYKTMQWAIPIPVELYTNPRFPEHTPTETFWNAKGDIPEEIQEAYLNKPLKEFLKEESKIAAKRIKWNAKLNKLKLKLASIETKWPDRRLFIKTKK